MHLPFPPRYSDEDTDWAGRGPVARLRSWTNEKRRQRIRRDGFNTLLRVNTDVLEDITGLTREQVEHAARLPLHMDAAEMLRTMRLQRPGMVYGLALKRFP